MWRLRRSGKSYFFLVFIGFSILVMLTLRGCWKWLWGYAPCARDDSQLIFLWARHPLSRLPPCHLSPWILLKWQGICSSRSDRRFVAHYGVPDWSAEKTWIRFYKVQVWARTTRGPSPSRSEDLATHAPPPPAARVRERRGSERGKPSHSFLIPL